MCLFAAPLLPPDVYRRDARNVGRAENSTPANANVQSICSTLMTPVLAKRLGRNKAEQLLVTLNGHEESPTVRSTGSTCPFLTDKCALEWGYLRMCTWR